LTTVLNLEMGCTDEMIGIALQLRPYQVTLVPERRQEITTEAGLDVVAEAERLAPALRRLGAAGIRTSLFIAPAEAQVRASAALDVAAIELHTGAYSHAPGDRGTLAALQRAAALGAALGVAVHAGHGLTVRNVAPVAAIAEIEELNIGHSIVSRAMFVGMEVSVKEMLEVMRDARGKKGRGEP
jgi:pyridoxine 5-phosphate synthase